LSVHIACNNKTSPHSPRGHLGGTQRQGQPVASGGLPGLILTTQQRDAGGETGQPLQGSCSTTGATHSERTVRAANPLHQGLQPPLYLSLYPPLLPLNQTSSCPTSPVGSRAHTQGAAPRKPESLKALGERASGVMPAQRASSWQTRHTIVSLHYRQASNGIEFQERLAPSHSQGCAVEEAMCVCHATTAWHTETNAHTMPPQPILPAAHGCVVHGWPPQKEGERGAPRRSGGHSRARCAVTAGSRGMRRELVAQRNPACLAATACMSQQCRCTKRLGHLMLLTPGRRRRNMQS
jgi:hypothetical protein